MTARRGDRREQNPNRDSRNDAADVAADSARPHEQVDGSTGFILPGGKVDADAMQRALEEAQVEGEEDDLDLRRVTFKPNRDLQKRLDKYLSDRIGFLSRTQIQRLIDDGDVKINGRTPKSSTIVREGDFIEVIVPPPPSKNIVEEDIPLDVLFEDDDLIVLNKQPDIIVHPARSHLTGTMLSALAFHFKHRSPVGGALSAVGHDLARPGVVHRLDRHTSGCIVFAKRDETHWKLGHQFEHRQVDKRYLAVVHGRVEPDIQVIDLPLGPHRSREKGYREKYVVRHDELGKQAVTICRVRERFQIDVNRETKHFTLVELELKTGRTHQIRVHLSYLEWPIVGDDMYGGKAFADAAGNELIARQALHATVLGFRHPVTEASLVFTAPLRGDIATLVRDLRHRSGDAWQQLEPPGSTVDLRQAVGEQA